MLSLVRRFGQLSKIEVARMTGLSVQSTSTIMNRLQRRRTVEARGAVARARRPADGAGLARPRGRLFARTEDRPAQLRPRADRLLRRRSAIARARLIAYPTPEHRDRICADGAALDDLRPLDAARSGAASPGSASRSPFQLWSWSAEIGAPAGAMDGWRSFPSRDEIGRLCPYPVTLCNDATSACAAEFFFGEAWRERDFLYFFLGEFVGGGLVLDGSLYLRPHRQRRGARLDAGCAAGAAGVDLAVDRRASIYQLERRLEAAGRDPSSIWRTPDALGRFRPAVSSEWIDEAVRRARLRFDRGDLRDRRRRDRDRRGDAGRGAPDRSACASPRRSKRSTGAACRT